MNKRCKILIACLLAVLLHGLPAAAQGQSQEQMAAYYFDQGEYEQAAQLYESLYERTTNKYYYQRLYATYLKLGEYRDAIRLAEKRQKKQPKELALHVDEGNVYLVQKQTKKAEKCFDKAIEAITSNLAPVPDLAMAFSGIGRHDYAAKTYLKAREQTRNPHLYFNELVGVYQAMGDHEAMTHEYFDLLDKQPSMMPSIQISMQKTLQEAPDERLAEGVKRALVERVREHPDNRSYLEMMIWFALQQKDFRFALTQARAVDARFPDQGGEHLTRVAQIAYANEDYDVAAESYRLVQQKGQEHPHYFDARVGELEVDFARINHNYSIDSKSFAQLMQKYEGAIAELGKNERTIPLMRHYANLKGYHGNDAQAAASMLDDVLERPACDALVAWNPGEAAIAGDVGGRRETRNAFRVFVDPAVRARDTRLDRMARLLDSDSMRETFERVCETPLDEAALRLELCLDTDGFWLEPHTDIGAKKLTLLISLSTGDEAEQWGTDLMTPQGESVARASGVFNSGVLFIPSDRTWHGFVQRPIRGTRRTLIVNFVDKNWRAVHELAFGPRMARS